MFLYMVFVYKHQHVFWHYMFDQILFHVIYIYICFPEEWQSWWCSWSHPGNSLDCSAWWIAECAPPSRIYGMRTFYFDLQCTRELINHISCKFHIQQQDHTPTLMFPWPAHKMYGFRLTALENCVVVKFCTRRKYCRLAISKTLRYSLSKLCKGTHLQRPLIVQSYRAAHLCAKAM